MLQHLSGSRLAYGLRNLEQSSNPWGLYTRLRSHEEIDAWRRARRDKRREALEADINRKKAAFLDLLAELQMLSEVPRPKGIRTTRWAEWMLAVRNLTDADSESSDRVLAELAGVSVSAVYQWRSRGLRALDPLMSRGLREALAPTTGRRLAKPADMGVVQATNRGLRRRDLAK